MLRRTGALCRNRHLANFGLTPELINSHHGKSDVPLAQLFPLVHMCIMATLSTVTTPDSHLRPSVALHCLPKKAELEGLTASAVQALGPILRLSLLSHCTQSPPTYVRQAGLPYIPCLYCHCVLYPSEF